MYHFVPQWPFIQQIFKKHLWKSNCFSLFKVSFIWNKSLCIFFFFGIYQILESSDCFFNLCCPIMYVYDIQQVKYSCILCTHKKMSASHVMLEGMTDQRPSKSLHGDLLSALDFAKFIICLDSLRSRELHIGKSMIILAGRSFTVALKTAGHLKTFSNPRPSCYIQPLHLTADI